MATEKLFIGRKVRGLRENARATQAQFAERLGISASYLNQIENNQRPGFRQRSGDAGGKIPAGHGGTGDRRK